MLKSEAGMPIEYFKKMLESTGDPAKALEEKDENGSTLFLNIVRKVSPAITSSTVH